MPERVSKGKLVIRAMKPFELKIYQEQLRISHNEWKVFAAVYDGRIVGICQVDIKNGKKEGRILSVSVSSNKQGKGIGHKLIGKAHSYFESKGIKKITVFPKNRVEKFYTKAKYQKSGKNIYTRISPNKRRKTK